MRKENYTEYLRLKRESKYLVEYALMLTENWRFYDSDGLMSFLEDVVRYLGSDKEYEKFGKYKMQVSL
ncbi:MAG: hypothetical protein ACRD38_06065 [Nitrososphaerales archaeon]